MIRRARALSLVLGEVAKVQDKSPRALYHLGPAPALPRGRGRSHAASVPPAAAAFTGRATAQRPVSGRSYLAQAAPPAPRKGGVPCGRGG